MKFFSSHSSALKKFGLIVLTVLLVAGGSFFQERVLQVQAAVQVLLVSRTAIAFGNVFPGEDPTETYTVQLDTSANIASYVTTLTPLPNVQNLCPFLTLKSIDNPPEPDTLANATLKRPGDVLDKWQVSFEVPGFSGQLSQDNNGGIVVVGGNYGCKITITTTTQPGKIIICKKSLGGTGNFAYGGDLGEFTINTGGQGGESWGNSGNNYDDKNNNNGDCATRCDKDGVGDGYYNNLSGPNNKDSNSNGGNNNYDNNNYNGGGKSGDGGCDKDDSGQNNGNSQNGLGEKVFQNLAPGSYSVSEFAQSGWNLTSLSCSDPNNNSSTAQNIASITLDSGETVKCTFVNTKKKGTIVIQKNTVGGDGKFYFSGDLGGFNLQTQNYSASQSFNNLAPGSYSVTESQQTGWKLSSIVCTDPSHNSSTYNSTANIKLAAGETVTCVFTNKKQGKIIIHKKTGGNGDSCGFSGSEGDFSIPTQNGQGTKEFDNLDSGNYNISESSSGGYGPQSVVCTNSSGVVVNSHGASINLQDGQTVDCTFTNGKGK